MKNFIEQRRRPPREQHRGAALLMCLFVIFMVSSLVLNMLDTETKQLAATRNVTDYERALYLANAGVQHACAELAADTSWLGTVSEGIYPADDSYTATATDAGGGIVLIQASGAAGDIRRSVEARVEL